jgi:5-methylcytosine-specific restriction endonuclease McrA
MRTKVPDGDLAAIIEEAVTEKLERLEARRFATTKTPKKGLSKRDISPSSRRVPAAVRRAVWKRDGGRCRYVNEQGGRCTERHRLEFHHIHPFALGGDHDPDAIRLMCRTHNLHLAEHDYGRQAMARYRRSGNPGSKTVATPLPRTAGATRPRDSITGA